MRSTFTAVVTARLVPGMRASGIVALGLSGVDRRTSSRPTGSGAGLWAALSTRLWGLGTASMLLIGGHETSVNMTARICWRSRGTRRSSKARA